MPPELPPLHVFLGDTHAGSKVAPLVPFTDADGVQYSPSTRTQLVLNGFLAQALADVKAAAKGHRLILHLGGDLVDGVAHHSTTQTIGNHRDQRQLAAAMLLPWVNLADAVYGLLGTEAHTGADSEEDKTTCELLGVEARHWWPIESGGRVLDWAHHTSVGGKWWGQEGPLLSLANDTRAQYQDRKERAPDLIVRHHVHRYVRTHAKGTDIFTTPGWQAQTNYTYSRWPNSLLTVGAVLWYPQRNYIHPLLYPFPPDPIVKVTYAPQAKKRRRPVLR